MTPVMKRFIFLLLLLSCSWVHAQNLAGTYAFATRDTCELYLDIYDPSPGSETTFEGHAKPTILYVFGGGFFMGSRSAQGHLPWFKLLNDNGYKVVTIDYRLGLKGVEMKFNLLQLTGTAKKTKHAVDLGVEDLFSAVRYICDHAGELDIDPQHIVIAGSSAGAMIALSAEYEICNGSVRTPVLPEGFNFAGVMSFAGAIMSSEGKPVYKNVPCPQLLMHGTKDRIVQYSKLHVGRWGLFGTSSLAGILQKKGAVAQILRYLDHGHDISAHMAGLWPEEKRFLEETIMLGKPVRIDAMIDDPSLAKGWTMPAKALY